MPACYKLTKSQPYRACFVQSNGCWCCLHAPHGTRVHLEASGTAAHSCICYHLSCGMLTPLCCCVRLPAGHH
jgi:hypothetical protein